MERVVRASRRLWRGLWLSLCHQQPWQIKDFPILTACAAPTAGDKVPESVPVCVPFGGGGRNEEGLGDFIRRWEGREESPPTEQ